MAVTMTATLTENSYNVANNTSSVTLVLKTTTTYGSYNHTGTASGSVTFGGNASGSYSFKANFNANTTTQIYSKTLTVTHNADGTGSVSASASFATGVSSGTIYASASKTLTTIPRASTPSVSGTTQLGSAITINTNRASSSFTHTLTWSWAGKSGTIATGVGASTTWTPSIATFAPYLTNATSSTCTVTCTTYSGSTSIGSKTVTFTLSIPSSVVPSISSVTLSDAYSLTSTFGKYVDQKSSVKASVSASGTYSSTISKYSWSMALGSASSGSTTSSSMTLGVPQLGLAVGADKTVTGTFTVTDTRGRTASKTASITVTGYAYPSISLKAIRYDTSAGKEDDESTTIRVTVSGSTENVAGLGTNSATAVLKYKVLTASSYTQLDSRSVGTSWSYTYDITGTSVSSKYDVYVVITDTVGSIMGTTSASAIVTADTAKPVMDFKADGTGIAFLGISTEAGVNVNSDLAVSGQVKRTGKSTSWVNGRINALVRSTSSGSSDYTVLGSIKTTAGSWEIGQYSGSSEKLYFSYISDTNYNAGTDSQTASYYMDKSGGFYSNTGRYLQGSYANSFWGIVTPDSNWLRVANSNGLIPYQSGGAGGLGTSTWPWASIYGKNIYKNGCGVYGATVLFTGSTNGTVTLSSSAANFTLLVVFYKTRAGSYSSTAVYSPNGKHAFVWSISYVSASYLHQLSYNHLKISGTSITTSGERYLNITSSVTSGSQVDQNYVVAVIGFA